MIDWNHIEQTVLSQYRDRMEATPQSPCHHGEGDVYRHTRMVVEALLSLPEYHALPERQRNMLRIAALLHDAGKVVTTKEVLGEIVSPYHAPAGSRMIRKALWLDHGMCGDKELQQARETICRLVRYHTFPPHAIDTENGRLKLHRIASDSLLLPDFSIKLLCILAKADMMGRICGDRAEMLDRIALCEELAKEEGCCESCYPFPSDYTRRAFLNGRDVWKEQPLYDDTWGEVILMSGLPGVGKDTWIRRNCPDLPMISLDEIRKAEKIPPTANQGLVANIARAQAKEYLRRRQPFVWNATDITAQMRGPLIELFETYRARVRIVYLETDRPTQLRQNASRPDAVPMQVLAEMLGKITPPEAFEAQRVVWIQ